ncbi:MAG: DUF1800 domain-containing protein [Cocleimonas sp.]|nr:DUF1800 domain-containing protein [Cocleimonas sp.]
MSAKTIQHLSTQQYQPESLSRRHLLTKAIVAAPVVSSLLLSSEVSAAVPGKKGTNRSLHAIQRMTMGVTPALLKTVKAMGVNAFIDQQLDPQAIDDSVVESMLTSFTRLHQDTPTLMTENKRGLIQQELNGATTIRAVFSQRHLQEVMTDFWSNHFNVDTNKKKVAMFKVAEDRQFRQLALGKFSDLLMTSAKSPAMSEYLDNRRSRANRNRTPNENYARELLELHTVGVNGGYDEDDVVEAAHVFSGWSINNSSYDFSFRAEWNDLGTLATGGDILGWTPVAASGAVENGESLIDYLAHHKTTANYICWKLCRHFIRDDIEMNHKTVRKTARVFLANDTAIVPTLRTLLRSGAFRKAKGKKMKRGNELLNAMLRATGATINLSDARIFGRDIRNQLVKHDHKLYECEPPTGYSNVATDFISTNAMVNRWNMGFLLIENKFSRRIQIEPSTWLDSPRKIKHLVKQLSLRLLGRQLQKQEKQALYNHLGKTAKALVTAEDTAQVAVLAGLIFASSSYQIR